MCPAASIGPGQFWAKLRLFQRNSQEFGMNDRTVLITGCSTGIGHSVALGLQARGYRVFATVRQEKDVATLTAAGLDCRVLDLRSSESIAAAVDAVLAQTGDRLYALLPLLVAFFGISSLYVWQASKHPTPWLFSDEIEYAQISRAIAETGKPARRGVEYWGTGRAAGRPTGTTAKTVTQYIMGPGGP